MRSFIQIAGGFILIMLFFTACSGSIETNFNTGDSGFVDWTDNPKIYAEGTFETEVPYVNQRVVRLTAVSGDVFIDGYNDAESIIVESQLRVGSDSLVDAEEQLAKLEIQVTNQDDEVLIRTIEPEKSGEHEYIVDYYIIVPSYLEADVTLVNGDITVQNIENSVSIVAVNGDMFLWDIFGNIDIDHVNGSIDSSVTLPNNGDIMIFTDNGNIVLNIPTSTSAIFAASGTNGSISTSNLEFIAVKQTLQSLTGTLGNGEGVIDLGTINGNITVIGFD